MKGGLRGEYILRRASLSRRFFDVKDLKSGLTAMQEGFCRELVADKKKRKGRAAIRAGYSRKTAAAQATRLLKNVKVQAFLAGLMAKRAKKLDIKGEDVLRELAKIGFSNMGSYAEFGAGGVRLKESEELTEDEMAAVAEVSQTVTKDGGTVRFKLHDKGRALHDVADHLGMFDKKLTLETEGPIQVTLAVTKTYAKREEGES